MEKLEQVKQELLQRIETADDPGSVMRSKEIKSLYQELATLPKEQKAEFGKQVNQLKQELTVAIKNRTEQIEQKSLPEIDVTAPMDYNFAIPKLMTADQGTIHPLNQEIARISGIFGRMGFVTETSREIDDQYHMFESLNFPKGHPARDDYDTFMTEEVDQNGDRFVVPAHTSTMQNRIIQKYRSNLDQKNPIAAIIPDRVFRNEDLDARHEHTFYQVEGIYIDKNVNVGNLVSTLQAFLEEYYSRKLEVRINPFYFPFTEPSFEFALSCPFLAQNPGTDCKVCGGEGWIELLGCGMIHPEVLRQAGVDPDVYSGFAFGCGIDRLVMMKYSIEDVRYFESARLDFLKQF